MRPLRLMPCLLALWAFALVPMTCGGGLLAHPCENDADPVCHHEESCPADPCNIVSLAHPTPVTGRSGDDALVPSIPPAATAGAGEVVPVPGCARPSPPRPAAAVVLRC